MMVKSILGAFISSLVFVSSGVMAEQFHGSMEDVVNISRDSYLVNSDMLSDENGDSLRLESIKDMAFRAGAQYGYIQRTKEIKDALESKSNEIDKVYNFSYLMALSSDSGAEMYLIPPIVKKFEDIKVASPKDRSLSIIEKKYVISKPARLVTTPVDWRQYLIYSPDGERIKVPGSLVPNSDKERRVWSISAQEGWHEGQQIAEREMLYRMERMADDYRGIILFNRLADEGKLIRPRLVETRIDVSGDDRSLVENKTIFTIVMDSKTQLDASDWSATILDNRDSMIFPGSYSNAEIEVKSYE